LVTVAGDKSLADPQSVCILSSFGILAFKKPAKEQSAYEWERRRTARFARNLTGEWRAKAIFLFESAVTH
jgi:hypothetical protein